jgi:hypothetical protein
VEAGVKAGAAVSYGAAAPLIQPMEHRTMHMRASACTRADLQRAFNEYAEAHGHDLAIAALKRSTGAREVSAVPDGRIINGLTELVCGFSFVGRSALTGPQAIADSPAKVHGGLAVVREKAFARMRGNSAQ